MTAVSKTDISEEKYLNAGRLALDKHEYYHGEIYAMSSTSIPNNIVLKKCGPFGSDLQIHIPNNSLYTYPDINIICGKIETYDKFDTATNPSVIIEILLASTRNYDK